MAQNHIHHLSFLIFSADLFCKVMQVRNSNIILNIYNSGTQLIIIETILHTLSRYGDYITNNPLNVNASIHTKLVAGSWWRREAWPVCVHSVWESGKRTVWETVEPDERGETCPRRKRSEIMRNPLSGEFHNSEKKEKMDQQNLSKKSIPAW